MRWFRKRNKVAEMETPVTSSNKRALVEIVANKEAKKEVIAQAKEANEHLQKLLEANHFTVTIFIAAGGKQRKPRSAKT